MVDQRKEENVEQGEVGCGKNATHPVRQQRPVYYVT